MEHKLDWFTTTILPNGRQRIHIRARRDIPGAQTVYLSEERSAIVHRLLDELAGKIADAGTWSAAKQAVLRSFFSAA